MERQLITSGMEMQSSVIRVRKGFENGFWIKLLAICLGFMPPLTLIHDPFWSWSEVWWIGVGLIEILCFIVLFTQFSLGSTTTGKNCVSAHRTNCLQDHNLHRGTIVRPNRSDRVEPKYG